jgi:hypothetical protein
MWSAHQIPQLHFQLSKPDHYFFIQLWLITCAVCGSGLLTSYMNSMVWIDRPEVVQVCLLVVLNIWLVNSFVLTIWQANSRENKLQQAKSLQTGREVWPVGTASEKWPTSLQNKFVQYAPKEERKRHYQNVKFKHLTSVNSVTSHCIQWLLLEYCGQRAVWIQNWEWIQKLYL